LNDRKGVEWAKTVIACWLELQILCKILHEFPREGQLSVASLITAGKNHPPAGQRMKRESD
jgi:hypothetical protein